MGRITDAIAKSMQIDLQSSQLELQRREQENRNAAAERANLLQALRDRTEARKTENESMTIKLNQGKDFIDSFSKLYAGRKDITPNEMNAGVKLFQEKFGIDATSMFQPNTDEKTGVTKSFNFTNADSMNKEIDNRLKEADIKNKQADTAIKIIDEKQKQLEFSGGKPEKTWEGELLRLLNNDPKFKTLSPEEKRQKVVETAWSLPTSSTQVMPQGTKKELQDSMIGTIRQSHDLALIEKIFDEDMLTYQGKLWNYKTRIGLKSKLIKNLSPEDEKFHTNLRLFEEASSRTVNQYTHDMSGAQFSIKEMERYRNSLFNTDLDKVEFKASFNDYVSFVKKSYRIKDMLVRKGFTGEALGKNIDQLNMIGGDPTLSTDAIKERGDELKEFFKSQGIAEDKLMEKINSELIREGYFQK